MRTALFLTLLLAASPAWAHKLKLFVMAEGTEIVGTAYFAGGDKAMGQEGRVQRPDGSIIARFRTDEDGAFRVPAPGAHAIFVLETVDGHMARTSLTGDIAADSGSETNAMEAALARQLRPLRQQLDEMEARARFSDVVGGIGFIFGLFGVMAWVAARRRGKS